MKHSLKTIYSIFILTFFSLFFQSTGFWQLSKYLLLIIASFMLYKKAVQTNKLRTYHFVFLATSVLYVLFRSMGYNKNFTGLTLLLVIASVIGMFTTFSFTFSKKYKEIKATPKAKLVPATKSGTSKKAAPKKAAKKTTKKVAKKATKKVAKKATKKKTTKKAATKKTTKKTAKRGRPAKK